VATSGGLRLCWRSRGKELYYIAPVCGGQRPPTKVLREVTVANPGASSAIRKLARACAKNDSMTCEYAVTREER